MSKPDKKIKKGNVLWQPQVIEGLVDDYLLENYPHLVKKSPFSLLFIFVDGLGIGTEGGVYNPLNEFAKSILFNLKNQRQSLSFNGIMIPTDPLLHVPGTPQSATGQTALFTGLDAARIMGHHVPAFPTFTLKKMIQKHSIFKRLLDAGFRPALANGYSEQFFEGKRRHHSASTLSYQACGMPFRSLRDINAGQALYMDITNRYARKLGYPLRKMNFVESAAVLSAMASKFDFTMFEYFLTDQAGHTMRPKLAGKTIELLEGFLEELLQVLDFSRVQLVITSDHGNIEDLSQKGHTMNLVPTFLWGPQTEQMAESIHDLVDVHRAMCRFLGISFPDRSDWSAPISL